MSTKKVIVKDDVKYGWKLVTMKPSDYSWFLQEQRYERCIRSVNWGKKRKSTGSVVE